MTDKKISELDAITGANTAATDVFVVVDTSTGQTKKITREELNNAIEQDVLSSIDIDTINGDFSVNGNINLGDNNKAIFGAGSDLEIYHDGSDSYIRDAGTGSLVIQASENLKLQSHTGEFYFQGIRDGASKIYYNNAEKLVTTSTGIDVTGTVTADGLSVSAASGAAISVANTGTVASVLMSVDSSVNSIYSRGVNSSTARDLRFMMGSTERMRIDSSGRLGLGTAPPSDYWGTNDNVALFTPLGYLGSNGNYSVSLYSNGYRNSSGGFTYLGINGNTSTASGIDLQPDATIIFRAGTASNTVLQERIRLDSSGRFLTGKTASNFATTGVELHVDGTGIFTKSSSTPLTINRKTNDGGLVAFYKDGTTVGSIGTSSTANFNIHSSQSGHVGLEFGSPNIMPMKDGALADNAVDLGLSSQRFKDLYLGGGLRADTLTFSNLAGSERARLDSSGNLMVATTDLTPSTGGFSFRTGATNYAVISHATGVAGGNYYISFRYGTSNIGTITQSGTTGVSYNTSSDYRLKENVTGITDGIERVKQLNPSRFNFIADADRTVDGFLAHEAATVVPEAVTGEKDAVDEDGNPDYQGIDQAKLVPLLTAALQEAITKIEDLEARVATLEGN